MMQRYTRLGAVLAIVLAATVVTGTGAFDVLAAERTAVVDVSGDASAWLGLTPHSGPNGAYATVENGRVALDVSAANDQLASSGVNSEAYGLVGRVVNVSNHGTRPVDVWVTDDSDAVSFFTSTDGHGVVEGEESAITLTPGETMELGFGVNTSGVAVGTRLLETVTIFATTGASVPDGTGSGNGTGGNGTDGGYVPPGDVFPPTVDLGNTEPIAVVGSEANTVSVYTGVGGLEDGPNDPRDANVTITGIPGDHFGETAAIVGDVNGDGFADVAVGAPKTTGDSTVYVYFGPFLGDRQWDDYGVAYTTGAGDEFGAALAGAGDVNGDGYDDVLVGAPGDGLLFLQETGGAYLLEGGSDLSGLHTVSLSAFTMPGYQTFTPEDDSPGDGTVNGSEIGRDHFGAAVAGGGDVNGDGYADVLVGAPLADTEYASGSSSITGNTTSGEAYLYYGGPTGATYGARFRASPSLGLAFVEYAPPRLGTGVAMGDVNGDGYGDVLLGIPGYSTGSIYSGADLERGAAVLFYGGGTASTPRLDGEYLLSEGTDGKIGDARFVGVAEGDAAGTTLAVGDLNGDGDGDVVVGAPNATGPLDQAYSGAVYLVHGSASLAGETDLADADATLGSIGTTAATAPNFGAALATVHDVDADGDDELLVGAPTTYADDGGAAYLVYGSGSLSGDLVVTGLPSNGRWAYIEGVNAGDHLGVSVDGGD